MEQFHSFKPNESSLLIYNPLNAIVGPRPIGWISTIDGEGRSNISAFSFFTALNYTPPMIGFAIGEKKEIEELKDEEKDTLRNIKENGEFVYNLVSDKLIDKAIKSAQHLPHDCNEFEFADIESINSTIVKPLRVLGSPVNLECKVSEIVQLQDLEKNNVHAFFIIAEVVMFHVQEKYINEETHSYETGKAHPVLRSGNPGIYYRVNEEGFVRK